MFADDFDSLGFGDSICRSLNATTPTRRDEEREYARIGHRLQKGRENIPAAGTNVVLRGAASRVAVSSALSVVWHCTHTPVFFSARR
eukprot:1311261-Pyramimonas_sp.AAC.1